MTHTKMKEKNIDKEPIKEEQKVQEENIEEKVNGSNADNVSEDSAEQNAKSSEVADEASEWKDKYLRLVAEFDNYRKRTLKEKMDLIASGGEDVIKSLLAIMDDIDRALDAMTKSNDIEAIRQGIMLIHQKLLDTLHAKGVEEISAIGQELDTDLHEAVAKFPVAEEEKKGKVIDVVQKGYKLKDKVVRFAKVVVGE
ncbi:MAG TPA: nucleotide exchange factor GrpE [Candidatus Alistipes pullicola]|nr:nucleotide exchange factor GrpE [Candidatus Alistipes pullicola]